jgi:hypothetical protein
MEKTIILLGIMIFCSCETKNVSIQKTSTEISGREISVYEIDSCEYIGTIHKEAGDMITHKGNCKFCSERSKK